MQQKGAENVEQAKNTILLVRGTAAEPAALSAFTAAQPDVQLQAISGLNEAGAALERLRPTLIVLQSDAPDAQALHRCAELAETAEAVFLLLVRQEAYGAAWRTLQKHGVCVMTWPMEQAVLTQTLRNLLLLKKSMQTMQAQTDQLRSQLQDLKRIRRPKGLLMRQLGMTEQDAHRWIERPQWIAASKNARSRKRSSVCMSCELCVQGRVHVNRQKAASAFCRFFTKCI